MTINTRVINAERRLNCFENRLSIAEYRLNNA